jgi:CubicO group peptidase (beta-lactamase class C family)
MKKFLYILATLLMILGIAFVVFVKPMLPIATGYVARMTCTCTYTGNRDSEEIKAHNYYYSILPMVKTIIDRTSKSVEASIFGVALKRAEFRPGLGCILINEKDNYQVKAPNFTKSVSTEFWPQSSEPFPNNVNIASIKAAANIAFDDNDSLVKRTAALLVIYKDSIIYERYAAPFHKDMPLLGWSMTKSWMNTVIGLMIRDSMATLSDRQLFATWTDQRKDISLQNLLQMNSGLEWEEDYSKVSDATQMLYASDDVSSIAIGKPLDHPIAKHWYYSSGTSNLLSRWALNKFGNYTAYTSFVQQQFFKPLGMSSAFVEPDEMGTPIMSSYGYATARDWAKFGLLYLHDGMIGTKRILPEGWTHFSHSVADGSNGNYGAHFWLNKGKAYPDVTDEMYYADGYKGQFVFIIPSKDLVVVRLGGDGDHFDGNSLLREVISSLPK